MYQLLTIQLLKVLSWDCVLEGKWNITCVFVGDGVQEEEVSIQQQKENFKEID